MMMMQSGNTFVWSSLIKKLGCQWPCTAVEHHAGTVKLLWIERCT